MEPIIKSILDNDLYAFTMQQAILERYRGVQVEYNFIDRQPTGLMDDRFEDHLISQIFKMQRLQLTDDEADYLSRLGYLKPQYIDWLRRYRFDPDQVSTSLSADGRLSMSIRGSWEMAKLWEVPLLATVSELYFEHNPASYAANQNRSRLEYKGDVLRNIKFSDFGTRRRRSYEYQNQAIDVLKHVPGFQGTSNVHLARLHGVKPIGTMAHEWIMGVSALEGLRHANRHALRAWHDVYQGQLGIALTDTFGTEAFWEDFDPSLARLYDGVRQDSGDTIAFTIKAIEHYRRLGIDPKSKTIVYSDGLTAEKCRQIHLRCDDDVKQMFGIGTKLTNDVPNSPALNIVIKMRQCNGVEVVKLSDEPGKATGDRDALRVAKHTFFNTPLDDSE